MPIAWFLCPYKIDPGPRRDSRFCAMDDFTSVVRAGGGDWSEVEIDGNQAVARVRASAQTLADLRLQFRQLSETEARTAAEDLPRKLRYDAVNDMILFDGPRRRTKPIEDVVRQVPDTQGSQELHGLISLWVAIGFGLGWRLPWWLVHHMASAGIAPPTGGLIGLFSLFNNLGAFPTTGTVDTFIRANEDPLSDAGKWSSPVFVGLDSRRIVSNECVSDAVNQGSNYRNTQDYGPDTEAFNTISTKGTGDLEETGLLARLVDVGLSTVDGYFWGTSVRTAATDVWRMRRVDNGASTTLGATIAQEYASGDGAGGDIIGITLQIYQRVSGVWSSLGTRTDATYSAAGKIGIGDNGGAVVQALTNFGGGTIPPPEVKIVHELTFRR